MHLRLIADDGVQLSPNQGQAPRKGLHDEQLIRSVKPSSTLHQPNLFCHHAILLVAALTVHVVAGGPGHFERSLLIEALVGVNFPDNSVTAGFS